MPKYHIEVSGALLLPKIQNALNGEEALINTFIGSRLWINATHDFTNIVEFEKLEDTPESQPGLLTLSASAVDGLTPIW